MGTVPSLANSCGTPGDYNHKKQDLFDSVDYYHYSIVKNSDDGGGRVSPIYISLPSLPAVVISASASSSAHFPRDEKFDQEKNVHVYHTESCMNNAATATLHMEHAPPPPSIPKRTYRYNKNTDNSSGSGVPRDVSVKLADPISSCNSSNFSAILFPHHTIGGDRRNTKTTKTTYPFQCRQDEKSVTIRSSDQAYPAPNSGHHQHKNHHHQSQSQGFSSSSFQEEDCYYCCIDECTTFIDVNLLSEQVDEPFYSFLPFSSLSRRRPCTGTGITYCPTWSFPAPEPSAPLLPPRLGRSSRALVIGSSSFSKYLSDILEASVEVSHISNSLNISTMGLGDLSQDPVYTKLVAYWKENGSKLDMRDLFKNDPERFKKFRYAFKLKPVYIIPT